MVSAAEAEDVSDLFFGESEFAGVQGAQAQGLNNFVGDRTGVGE